MEEMSCESRTMGKRLKSFTGNWELYVLLLPALAYFVIFHYIPMYGVQIAFKDFIPADGIWGSKWVGFAHFLRFFDSYFFWDLIRNTLVISIYTLVVAFPIPIILALSINEIAGSGIKKMVQTVTYAPYFISTVVMCGMILSFLSPSSGIINKMLEAVGFEVIPFMSKAEYFPSIYVLSGVWQSAGWNSVIYLASLAGVDMQLHESAALDGASRLQRIWYINMHQIIPVMVISLIMSCGSILSVGYEKIYLLQNQLNIDTSEVISTYVYKAGLQNAQYSFASAVGLFNSAINLVMLVIVNSFAKKVNETSLW